MSGKLGAPRQEAGDTDLPVDLQRELLDLQERGAKVSHYEILGLDPSADKASIRVAYVERSKRMHPDRWRARNVGSFTALLTEAFKKVNEAYQILNDADARAAYDAVLALQLDPFGQKAIAARADARADEERRAAERRKRLFFTKGFARMGAARKLYEEALQHIEDGERALAIDALKTARQLDPHRREIVVKLAEVEADHRRARTFSLIEQAKAAEAAGDPAKALKAYQHALTLDQGSAAATLGAARAALAVGDLQASSSWALRAVEYAPRTVEPKLVLAKALIGLSQKSKAKAMLQAALELNPDHKEARALLKAL